MIISLHTSGIADRLNQIEYCLDNFNTNNISFYWLTRCKWYEGTFHLSDAFDINTLNVIDVRKISEIKMNVGDTIIQRSSSWHIPNKFIRTKNKFYPQDLTLSNFIRFNKNIINVANFKIKDINERIGLHIRAYEGKDNYLRTQEKLDLLAKNTEKRINQNENYFLSTDSEFILNYFKKYKNIVYLDTRFVNGFLDKESFSNACVALYLLSRCKEIYVTSGGFGIFAAALGKKPYIKIPIK